MSLRSIIMLVYCLYGVQEDVAFLLGLVCTYIARRAEKFHMSEGDYRHTRLGVVSRRVVCPRLPILYGLVLLKNRGPCSVFCFVVLGWGQPKVEESVAWKLQK